MENKPPLSPAAFSVVDAFVCANGGRSNLSSNADIAAALRTAAKLAKQAAVPHPSYTEEQFWAFQFGVGRIDDFIRTIADELEANA